MQCLRIHCGVSDSVQVIGSGILRGYKDTRSIFFITFTAYWVLGWGQGLALAFFAGVLNYDNVRSDGAL